MRERNDIFANVDWITITLYFILVLFGWFNIFAAVYDASANQNIFDLNLNSGKQLIWISASVITIIIIFFADFRLIDSLAYFAYGAVMLLLIAVLFFGREVAGSTSWFEIGSFRFQPSEFAKFVTALAMAKYLSDPQAKLDRIPDLAAIGAILFLPIALILLQGDAGTTMVFSIFVLVLFREGLSPVPLIIGVLGAIVFLLAIYLTQIIGWNQWAIMGGIFGIGVIIAILNRAKTSKIITTLVITASVCLVVYSVDFIFDKVLKEHQRTRILVLFNPDLDPRGAGYNVNQSKIAIGSGGFDGKGFLEGTQTKYDYVPEQSTDFIFCTIGEEHGYIGSFILVILFSALIIRVIQLAERQKMRFSRVYGYCVAMILFFHFAVNISMTIGLFPVIGIPLPFFSYGGSSLIAFTVLLFTMVKLDSHRMQVLSH
ncbi:rod shape-determining protein RodA [Marinigracilibium pacificum]|uniref:Cell wall polymerase n=1 Tax=Marinigracilibium pacificum TaxID=2729599 RepID=A0A848J5I3_9BACT|nr:rod shape-determining protein RodA [Marinigracilibium pacificum]NMM49780.1 rod shape-determining protein RodA [Marinigracilibium pacificum]